MDGRKPRQVIEDGFIGKMLVHPGYLKEFPFLREHAEVLKTLKKDCRKCGRKAADKAVDYGSIKKTLAAMPPEKQARLLDLAKAKSVEFVYRTTSGKLVKFVIQAKA